MIEAVAAEVLGGVVTHAGGRIGGQIRSAVRRRRNHETDEDAVASLLSAERAVSSKRLLKIDFPRSIDAKRFQELMNDPATEGIAFELLSASLVGAPSPSFEAIERRWLEETERLLPKLARQTRVKFATQLFEVLREECTDAAAAVRENYSGVADKFETNAHYHRIAAILEAIDRRLSSGQGTPQPSVEQERRFAESYRPQVLKAHGFITPPDFEKRKRVPIEDIYVSPSIHSSLFSKTQGQRSITTQDLPRLIDRTVLLGDPGNGKSTAASVLAYSEAAKTGGLLPILVVLREFAKGPSIEESIVEHIEKQLRVKYQCTPPAGLMEKMLAAGQCIVIFDGLDELLDTTKRREVTDLVELFCTRFPLARVLVTSRRVGYLQAPMDPRQFEAYEIEGFDQERTAEYVRKWFGQDEALTATEATTWTESFMEESEAVPDLRSVPLMLALMCIIYRGEQSIPRNRPALYERCATMLFEKWDGHRKIHVELRVGKMVDPAMKYLGYWMLTQQSETEGVTETVLVRQTSAYLQQHDFEDALEAEAAAKEFVEFCRGRAWVFSDAGSTADGEALYKFTHRTFMEYFAAYYLTRAFDTPERLAKHLAPKVANAEWDVVAQLAIQIEDKHKESGAERFYQYLLNERVKRAQDKRCNLLSFLSRCLSFVTVRQSTLRTLVDQLVEKAVLPNSTLTRAGFNAIYTAWNALSVTAVGPRKSVIQNELTSRLSRFIEAGQDQLAEARAALYLAAFGWTSIYAAEAPLGRHNRNIIMSAELHAEIFEQVFDVAGEALRLDNSINSLAWARGLTTFDSAVAGRTGVEALAFIWERPALLRGGLRLNSIGAALARYFLTEHSSATYKIADEHQRLSEIGTFIRSQERVRIRGAIDTHDAQIGLHLPSGQGPDDFSDLSVDTLIGGIWLVGSMLPSNQIRNLVDAGRTVIRNGANYRRATAVAELVAARWHGVPAHVPELPSAVLDEVARWRFEGVGGALEERAARPRRL